MEKYYISFGSGQLQNYNLPVSPINVLLEIEAYSEIKARFLAYAEIGDNFCTSYSEDVARNIMDVNSMCIITLDYLKQNRLDIGEYIVLEVHGGAKHAMVCMDSDGNSIVFDTEESAKDFAGEECQTGIVVKVG